MATVPNRILGTLFAQKPVGNLLENPDTWILAGLVLAVLLIGAGAISMADRWRKRQNQPIDPIESLTSFRELYERGELSKVEYDRILAKVAKAAVGRTEPRKPVANPPTEPKSPVETPVEPPMPPARTD